MLIPDITTIIIPGHRNNRMLLDPEPTSHENFWANSEPSAHTWEIYSKGTKHY